MSALATNPPVELARYLASGQQRVLRGQRIDGVVRVSDVPAQRPGRAYLVERGLTNNAELWALVADYLAQAERWDSIPALPVWIHAELEVA